MENDKMLVDFEFTDATHKVLKKVHLNFDNLSEEAGYILKEKAIPIEWIRKWRKDKWFSKEPLEKRMIMAMGVRLMLEDWEEENADIQSR